MTLRRLSLSAAKGNYKLRKILYEQKTFYAQIKPSPFVAG